ncbi:MAG: glycosyltransferase family 1 protein [Ferruginibacter sp.]
MKKVLVDLKIVGGNPYNGLYTYCLQLGKRLLTFPIKEFDLYYYQPRKTFGLFGDKVKYVAQRSIDKYYRFGTDKFDVWHATTQIAWYRPFNKKTRFLFTIHDLNFLIEYPEKIKINRQKLRLIQQRVDRADYLTFISNFAYNQASQYLDLRQKPFTIIYPGCALLTTPVDPAVPAYVPAKPFLFSLGLIQPRKNFHVLIPLLEGNDFELVISGLDTDDYKNVITAAARKYNVESRVILTGPVNEKEKVWYYQNCTAFLFPSFAEGFGLPIVEGMFYGKPVFLSRETSLPEIGGEAAYYFDSFDPAVMQKNFNDGLQHYHDYSPIEKIKERASRFTYDQTAMGYIEIYKQLIN